MIKGIDVSRYQGVINWKAVDASGIDFALIRAGYGNDISQKDANFETNIEGALAAGLEVGVYWFSYAVSILDALKEAAAFKKIITPYKNKITYPAAFDYEGASRAYGQKNGYSITNDLINQMANAFLSSMKAEGWTVALYTNNDFRKNVFSDATMKAWDLWLADYSGGPDVPCTIQQTGSTGRVSGISGDVDIDVSFKDYAALAKSKTSVVVDTAGTFEMQPGGVYQLKTTCIQQPKVWSGSPKSVVVLPRYRSGNDNFWWLVAVGKVGEGAGIYTAGPGEQGMRRLVVNIK